MASRSAGRRAGIVLAVAGIVLISLLRYLVPASMLVWHNILQHLYYLPIAFAGMYRGWKGGVGAAVFSAICYVTLFAARPNPTREFAPYAEIIDFFLVGLVVGILGDRERQQKQALERTSMQLGQVYRELQENFERMKRAERLYAIGQLSAGLAHEIRNPLASIEGAAAILQNDSGSEERRLEFLSIIQRECRRLNRLLTQFLDFARPRPPEYGSVDIGNLLESVMNLAQHGASEGIRLRKEVAPNLPVVRSDPEQLKQVILNLTINAIQGMPEGGEILLSARQRDDKVLIQVRDEGCGISEEHLDKVFDPFFTTKKDGTGLGLSVAHQIVSQHGGMLSMKRNPDKGMTFSVSLPLSEPA